MKKNESGIFILILIIAAVLLGVWTKGFSIWPLAEKDTASTSSLILSDHSRQDESTISSISSNNSSQDSSSTNNSTSVEVERKIIVLTIDDFISKGYGNIFYESDVENAEIIIDLRGVNLDELLITTINVSITAQKTIIYCLQDWETFLPYDEDAGVYGLSFYIEFHPVDSIQIDSFLFDKKLVGLDSFGLGPEFDFNYLYLFIRHFGITTKCILEESTITIINEFSFVEV